MDTKEFATKTLIEKRDFPSADGFYPVSIDVGYSAVKGFGPHGYFCIPSYVRKRTSGFVTLREPEDTDILYRDRGGEWAVGELAYQELSVSEIVESETELFTRMRYYSPQFIIPARVGLALSLAADTDGCSEGRPIAVQTGLPPMYLREDTKYIEDVFQGEHDFELRVGTGQWTRYRFHISRGNIYLMPQPMGSLVSVSVDSDGRAAADAGKYLRSNVVIFDPGFGTLDDYNVVKGTIQGSGNTDPGLGMREVLSRTCRQIYETYGVQISVPQLQERLCEGKIWVNDIRSMKRKSVEFSSLLEKNCRAVCADALEKSKTSHSYFQNTDFIIGTGGTYDAWRKDFDAAFSDMEGLKVVPANINDPSLPNIFSNARGYYFRLLRTLGKRSGSKRA